MRDELLPYYNRELAFMRRLGAEFAEAHPKIAGRLSLGPDAAQDPHVERCEHRFALPRGQGRDDEPARIGDGQRDHPARPGAVGAKQRCLLAHQRAERAVRRRASVAGDQRGSVVVAQRDQHSSTAAAHDIPPPTAASKRRVPSGHRPSARASTSAAIQPAAPMLAWRSTLT